MFASNIELITISVSCLYTKRVFLSALKTDEEKNSSLFPLSTRLHCVYRVRLSPLLFISLCLLFVDIVVAVVAVVVVTATFLSFIFVQFLFISYFTLFGSPHTFSLWSSYLGIISDVSLRYRSIQYYCQLFHLKRNAHHSLTHRHTHTFISNTI